MEAASTVYAEVDETLEADVETVVDAEAFTEPTAEPQNEMLDPKYWRPSRADNKVFMDIDRNLENQMVDEYQRTDNQDIYTKLYVMREPTLWVLARKFAYLSDSEEDLFAELRPVWMKAIRKYRIAPSEKTLKTRSGEDLLDENGKPQRVIKTTDFNTVLFTYCKHYMINQYKKKFATKKRLDANGNPVCNTTRSLDFTYGDTDEESCSMHELIPDETAVGADQVLGVKWIIDQIAGKDQQVREALIRYAYNPSFDRLSKACQVMSGSVKVRKAEVRVFHQGGKAAEALLEKLIEASGRFPNGCKVLNWQVGLHRADYEVSVNDWDLYERVLKAIRKVKSHFESDKNPGAVGGAELQAFFEPSV